MSCRARQGRCRLHRTPNLPCLHLPYPPPMSPPLGKARDKGPMDPPRPKPAAGVRACPQRRQLGKVPPCWASCLSQPVLTTKSRGVMGARTLHRLRVQPTLDRSPQIGPGLKLVCAGHELLPAHVLGAGHHAGQRRAEQEQSAAWGCRMHPSRAVLPGDANTSPPDGTGTLSRVAGPHGGIPDPATRYAVGLQFGEG